MSAPDFPLLAKVRDAARRLRGAWLALPCVLGALAGPVAAEDPPFVPTLTKVMSYTDIVAPGGTFGGDVSINAYGKWIAASPKGVFISTGTANTTWQQVFAGASDPMVNANTSTILCRISDSGSWVVLSRAGLYRSPDANQMEGVLVNAGMGTNNVYDMDMRPNGNWIASASTGTWRFMNGAVAQVLTQGATANALSSTRRIVRINSNGDWIIMTVNGVYRNGISVLSNGGGLDFGTNGTAVALVENLSATTVTSGVYKGGYVLEPRPPQPAAATFTDFTLSWTNSGGSTVGFKVAVSQPEGPAGGTELYSGSAETFTVTDFSRFGYGMNHLTLRAVNASGGVSEPVVFEYQTAPFQVLAHALDFPAQTATLSWNSLPGKSYTIQKSTALQSWEPLELAGTGEPPATTVTAAPGQWTMTPTALDPLLNTPQQPRAFLQVKATP
jgi:hypothetical protein